MKAILKGAVVSALMMVSLLCNVLAATEPELVWNNGALVLASKQVITGEICVQGGYDLILFRNGSEITVYPAHKINSLRLYDPKADINRRYISRVTMRGAMKTYGLYEVVTAGTITVLRKQTASQPASLSDAFDFDYYLVHGEEMFTLNQFREKVYPAIMAFNDIRITNYLKDEHLNPNMPDHAIRIILFYNKIASSVVSPQQVNY